MKWLAVLLMLGIAATGALAMGHENGKSCPAAPAVAAHVLNMHGVEGVQGPYIAMVAQNQEMFGDRCDADFHHNVHHYLHGVGAATAPE